MNIFYVDDNPEVCARFLDDARLNKMLTETSQILSTAISQAGGGGWWSSSELHQPTHINHPCVRWAAASRDHYCWLCRLFKFMHLEYALRTGGKMQATITKLNFYMDPAAEYLFPDAGWTPPPNCTDCRDEVDVKTAYRYHLTGKWHENSQRKLHHRHYSATWRFQI
jgi:hypothetical protein